MGGESASCTSDRGYYLPTNKSEGHMNSDDDACVISAWASAAANVSLDANPCAPKTTPPK